MLPDHFPSHLQTVCKPLPQAMSGPEITPDQNMQNGEPRDQTSTAPASAQPAQGVTPAGTTLEDTICHDAVDPRTYGLNTPTKRSSTSGAWKEIKPKEPRKEPQEGKRLSVHGGVLSLLSSLAAR